MSRHVFAYSLHCSLSNIFEEQEGICTHWGSIKSKSCLFQGAHSLPLLFVHLSTAVREELMMWTEGELRTCPLPPLPPQTLLGSAVQCSADMISYLTRMVSWMLIICQVSWWCEHLEHFAPANLNSPAYFVTAMHIWFKLHIWSVERKNQDPKILYTTKQYRKTSRCTKKTQL